MSIRISGTPAKGSFVIDSDGYYAENNVEDVLKEIYEAITTGTPAWAFAAHPHDTETMQFDAINSDGGAFSFNTTGAVTFNQAVAIAGTLTGVTDLSMTGELDLTGASACIDLNPASTGSKIIFDLTPSASLVAGSSWKGVSIDCAALDPAAGVASTIIACLASTDGVHSIDGNATCVSFESYHSGYDSSVGFRALLRECVSAGLTQTHFYSRGLTRILSQTDTYQGLWIDWDGVTRDGAAAPILEGVRVELPADYTSFGTSFAGYFSGDGRIVKICTTDYAIETDAVSSIFVADSNNYFASTDVEGVLAELYALFGTVTGGLDWQASVIDKDLTNPPGGEGGGERYIVAAAGAGGFWTGKEEQMCEYDGNTSTWDFMIPDEGTACWVEDEDTTYVFSGIYGAGGAWVKLGTTISHANLANLGADDHTQYLLADGTRDLNAASFNMDFTDTLNIRDTDDGDAVLFALDTTARTLAIGAGADTIATTMTGTLIVSSTFTSQGLATVDGLVPEADVSDSLGTVDLTWLEIFVQDIKDSGGNVIFSFDGSGELDSNVTFADGVSAVFGSDTDMYMYHSGAHGFLSVATGNLYVDGGGYIYFDLDDSFQIRDNNDADAILFDLDTTGRTLAIGAAADNVATTINGTLICTDTFTSQGLATVDGLVPEGDLADSLGTVDLTWLNLYVQDIYDAAANQIIGTDGAGKIDALATVTSETTFEADVNRSGAAASSRSFMLQTSGSDRIAITLNNEAEGGADAGSNFTIARYSDAGAYLGTSFKITRADGTTNLYNNVIVGGTFTSQGLVTADGVVPEADLADDLGTAALTWLNIYAQDYYDAGGNQIIGTDGAGNIDALATLSTNITFAGAETVDGVDVSAFKTAYDAHLHDGDTMLFDGVNSDGGAFAFDTTGAVTFNQSVVTGGSLTFVTDLYTSNANGISRLRPTATDKDNLLRLQPSGTAVASFIEFGNTSDANNFGILGISVNAGTAAIYSSKYGTGTALTTLNINDADWDTINIGDGAATVNIGGVAFSALHDGDTLQLDGINSDGGAFAFTTSGAVTFNQNVVIDTKATGQATFIANAQTDADSRFFFQENDGNKAYLQYDATNNKFMLNNMTSGESFELLDAGGATITGNLTVNGGDFNGDINARGQWNFDTDSGNKKFYISRLGGTTQCLETYIDDGHLYFRYDQDEVGAEQHNIYWNIDSGASGDHSYDWKIKNITALKVTSSSVQVTTELDVTGDGGVTGLVDINPSGTGSQYVVSIWPSASLAAGSTWRAVDMELGSLDPATGTPCTVHGIRINAVSMLSVDHDMSFYGQLVYGCPADNSYGFYYSPGEMTQNKTTTGFYSYLSGAKSATATYKGLYLNWGGTTRDGGAPALQGLNITLPASYTDFGSCYAGYFSGGGRTVTICNDTYALYLTGKMAFNLGTSITEFSIDGGLAGNSDDAIPTEKAVKTYVDAAGGADYDADLNIGSENADWINCPYEGPEGTLEKMNWHGALEPVVGGGAYKYTFSVPLPTTRGGKSLYINGTRVSLCDADGNNRVWETNLYGMADSTYAELDSDETNKNAIGLWEDTSMGNKNFGGYDVAKVILNTSLATSGNLEIQYVTVRYYYA